MQHNAPRLHTVAEAAGILRVKPKTIRHRIMRQLLVATKPPGSKSWLIPESELKRVVNEGITT